MQVQTIPFLYGKNTFCQLLLKNKISKSDEIDINSSVEIMKNASLCIAGRNLSAIIIGKDYPPMMPNVKISETSETKEELIERLNKIEKENLILQEKNDNHEIKQKEFESKIKEHENIILVERQEFDKKLKEQEEIIFKQKHEFEQKLNEQNDIILKCKQEFKELNEKYKLAQEELS